MAYSNFLIDTSKKAYVKAAGSQKGGLGAALLKGDIDPRELKQVGFTYKEEFEEGSNVLDGAMNKYGTQFKSIIDGVLTDSLKGKFTSTISGAENSDLKAKITTLMAFAMQSSGQVDDAKMAEILEGFNLALRYRIPYRKKMPSIQQSGNSFTIQFAYGKCNLFNAEKEVWEPVRTIKECLFPTVSPVEGHPGLVTIGGTKGVPYTQQSLYHVMRGVGQLAKEDTGMASLSQSGLEIQKAARELISKSEEAEAINAANTYIANIKEDLQSTNDDERKKAFKNAQKFIEQASPTGKDTLKKIWEQRGAKGGTKILWKNVGFDVKDPEVQAEVISILTDTWNEWHNTFSVKEEYLLKDEGEHGDSHRFSASKIEPDGKETTGKSLLDILKQVVNFQMYVEGAAAEATYQGLVDSADLFYLYYGFPQKYCHSQEEIEQYCTVSSNAGIKLGPFLPEDVEIIYDWEHLDDSGCPMAASVKFKKIFAIAPYGQGLLLKGEPGKLLGL